VTLVAWVIIAAVVTWIIVFVSSSQGATVSQSAPSGVTAGHPQSAQPTSDSTYTAYDLAYCKTRGKLVRVAASASFRAAVCQEGGQLVYYGLNKKTADTIRLTAVTSGDAYTATNAGTTYRIRSTGFSITNDSGLNINEPLTYWLGPGDRELDKPGDLGISTPISYPDCDGRGVVILGTSYDPHAYATEVEALLRANPGAQYLRTDLSCDNFRGPSIANSGGSYIYAVYRVMGRDQSQLCEAVKQAGTYGDWLGNDVDPTENVSCP
jgi:hypothetical protein